GRPPNTAPELQVVYRVVTSMRVPASLAAGVERAKTEWDVVLLSRAVGEADTAPWDVGLLVEAKASIDAVATDFPRLLRGVQLLAGADRKAIYQFQTREGMVQLSGASLSRLSAASADLEKYVLYCCDGTADSSSRLLSAASRMQLLS